MRHPINSKFKIRAFFTGGLFIFLSLCFHTLHAVQPASPGGSNYAWYNLTQPAPLGMNCRENYGIIKNYQNAGVRTTVQTQLQQMRANGQNRLRIPIYHMRNASGGTLLDSNGGDLSTYDKTSLTLFLSDIKAAGFHEILVGFFPVGGNNPLDWTSWSENLFLENRDLIFNLHPIIDAAKIPYRIDLMNEGAPASHQTILKQYMSRLWVDYNVEFEQNGKNKTVGFSFAAGGHTAGTVNTSTAVNRYNTAADIYAASGYGAPYVLDMHIYADIKNVLEAVNGAMTLRGDGTGLIIGETYYNNTSTWSDIQAASVGRTIWHVYQWPLSTSFGCDGHVDITPPTQYMYY